MTLPIDDERSGPLRRSLHWVGTAHPAHRYRVLFYVLLGTLAAAPFLNALRIGTDLLEMLLAFSLLVALLDVQRARWRVVLIAAVAVAIALRVAPASAVHEHAATGALALATAVALIAAGSAVRFALGAGVITAERVFAALSAYLLAGLFFGLLYWDIELTWPGSFGEAGIATAARFPLSPAIYFSFVTLATLGYGDVVPKSDLARGLAVLEAVGGQLYIAVTIARLVGSYIAAGSANNDRRSR